ncbi:MAG: sigma-70 family RNA polymerase sigma factor [bacterium]|nr:sigma-70 family RNA polymerase sigma factor [bacterium]
MKLQESQLEDERLIQSFQSNNSDAFDKLVQKHTNMVFNLCYRLMGDYDEANDCAQDTFIKVYHNLDRFKFKSNFSTWLYRIAVNTCKNKLSSLSSRVKKKTLRLDNRNDEDFNRLSDIEDSTFNPEEIFEKKEKEGIIRGAINALPPNQKTLIVLRDIEGKSYDEIAKITGYKPGTVKSKLARARQSLRDRLKGVL